MQNIELLKQKSFERKLIELDFKINKSLPVEDLVEEGYVDMCKSLLLVFKTHC